ncbi:MAG: DUF433 domain-containing protein [Candidatus Binataceae bacterium]
MTSERIESNPEVMMGKPVIRGTQVTVALILRKLSEGLSEDQLVKAYPELTREDIRAAIRYAADVLGNGVNGKDVAEPRGGSRSKLERLKAERFAEEGKPRRIASSLRALEEFRWKPRLSAADIRWIAEDVDLEDL